DELPLRAVAAEPVRRPARDDDIVALAVRQIAVDRLEDARALVDEDDLVALAVPVEELHRLVRPAERDLDVRVPHQQAPSADRVALLLDAHRPQVPVGVRVRHPLLALDRFEGPELGDTGDPTPNPQFTVDSWLIVYLRDQNGSPIPGAPNGPCFELTYYAVGVVRRQPERFCSITVGWTDVLLTRASGVDYQELVQ